MNCRLAAAMVSTLPSDKRTCLRHCHMSLGKNCPARTVGLETAGAATRSHSESPVKGIQPGGTDSSRTISHPLGKTH